MAGLCESANEPPGSLKATVFNSRSEDRITGWIARASSNDIMEKDTWYRLKAQLRMDISRLVIVNPMDDGLIRKIVTCDEKWSYYRKPGTSKQDSILVSLPKSSLNKIGSASK
ncbi:hypothetical protein ANN_14046 [Periplaneta americana]|uniref:Uncharacterized protein n=1 Tax=Periplaneta americana TaxID=6978 RepID=A0ABQ8SWS1_PERAM|nr:hypothetical protein ANN_14046 [Periplaneta americana]